MPEKSSAADDRARDHLLVRHPEGKSDRFPLPEGEGDIVKIGRELDNNVVLTDPKASRHHAELRRMAGVIEIKDLGSANGTLVNDNKLEADTWIRIKPGQVIQIAETRLIWEQDLASQSTMPLKQQPASTVPSAVPPPVVQSPPTAKPETSLMPWAIGIGLVLLILIVAGLLLSQAGGEDQPGPVAQSSDAASDQGGLGDPASQSLGELPAPTATPSGPQLAIPVIEILSVDVLPIIFGASPNTTDAYIFIDVRARNVGNIPYIFSISNFTLRTREGQEFAEAGSKISENYLRTLGAIDRFENLSLTPGGSVPGSLVYELPIGTYDFDLVFEAPELKPVVLGLGVINMDQELKLAAGTPAAMLDDVAEEPTDQPSPASEPTPTATRPPLIPAPQVVSRSALQGTLAFPVYNGETYDLYFGDVATGDTILYRSQASQPAFSPDDSRIALHSWDPSYRGLVTQDISGANGIIVANFIEDQLPTWTADGDEIILLTRRSGDRKSNLVKVGSRQERTEGEVIGEGEYPTIGKNGQLIFKGWETTGFGLRAATAELAEIQPITDSSEDTAPAPSPDGQQVAFMSRRSGQWDIYVIDLDGSNLRRLTDDDAQDGLPTWSPDGNAIAFVSERGGVWAVWAMTPDGLGKRQLFTLPGSADGFVGTDEFASRGWAEERMSWTSENLVP